MTFSIIAYDPQTGDYGVAVQSKFPNVGVIVPWARANVGAVATQANANTSFGPEGLNLLASRFSAEDALNKLLSNDHEKETRQVALIDTQGKAAAFTGSKCHEWAGHIVGEYYSVQGNILFGKETLEEMAAAFEECKGDLADKLIAALKAADKEGRGDRRGKQSASLLVVKEKGGYQGYTDRYIDIRVDDHPEPIKELERIFKIYDMTFLSREDPSNLLVIEGIIISSVKQVLSELGYYAQREFGSEDTWTEIDTQALRDWFGINNFENKWRDDGTIWKSVYDYLVNEKGSPYLPL